MTVDANDERWGGYIPWFLRGTGLPDSGDFQAFFSRVGQLLERCFTFDEAQLINQSRYGCMLQYDLWLETESFQRYRERAGKAAHQ
ncbi:MAG: hypothetical protein ACYCXT_02195 [Acidiferrobacteraceae bacterium]